VVSTGLATLSNQVQNGATGPFQKFKDGDSSIDVTLSLTDDGVMSVMSYDKKGKIKTLEKTVEEQAAQIESVTVSPIEAEVEPEPEIVKRKPRRRI